MSIAGYIVVDFRGKPLEWFNGRFWYGDASYFSNYSMAYYRLRKFKKIAGQLNSAPVAKFNLTRSKIVPLMRD